MAARPVPAQDEDSSSRWYAVETLNEGLGPVPETMDRSTPRSAVAGLLDAVARSDYRAAAHVLNLSRLSPAEQRERGPALARRLAAVIERAVWVDWSLLSGRADAVIENSRGDHPLAGEPRRNISLALLEARGRAYEVRLGRYKPPDGDPVWLFTPQTVSHSTLLYEEYGPHWIEAYIPEALNQPFWGLRLWEWAALPLLIGLLALVLWTARALTRALAGRMTRPTMRRAVAGTGMPLALVASAGILDFVLDRMVSFSGPLRALLTPTLTILAVVGVTLAALRMMDGVLNHVTAHYVGAIDDARGTDDRRFYTMLFAVRRVIIMFMVLLGVSIVLLELNLFASLGLSLLASAGILTVILGIAGQAVLGNILASLQIALAKPVRIGDSVIYEGHWAFVEAIYYTFIRLRTWDERRIIVPVKYFISHPFENWSMKNPRIMRTITLVLDHKADPEELRARFFEFAKDDDLVIEHDRLRAYVLDHGEGGQTIAFYAMAPDPSAGWVVEMRLRERMLAHIREHHPDWWPRERVAGPEGEYEDGEPTRSRRRLPDSAGQV